MARLTAQEATDKLVSRASGATADYRRGIERVSESPTEKAAASQEVWFARLQQAKASGKFAAGCRRVSLEQWKGRTLALGPDRLASGLDQSRDKILKFMGDLLAHVDKGLEKIKAIPKLTLEDSKRRATTWIDHMATFKRSS